MMAETNSNQKFLRGGQKREAGKLGSWEAQLGNSLIMMPRPQTETNENQHNRFAQHIGSPRRGAPGDEEPPPVLKSWRNLYLLVLGNLLFWIALFTLFTWIFK
jgi:hypothetical protein